MKTYRYGCRFSSGHVVAGLLLAALTLLAPAIQAAGTPTFIPGELQRQVYTNLPGLQIADLVNSAKFPDHPDFVNVVNAFETPTDSGDMYGERLTGFLVPPLTGDYVFYLASDDQGALFLSPDTTPANKVRIAFESGWNFPRNWAGMGPNGTNLSSISSPMHLEAGQRYYVEALHKEAMGGDNLGVAWQLPGEAPPPLGSPPISGQYLGREVPCTITIATPPFGQARFAGQTASFEVKAESLPTPTYQWCFNASPIPGATSETLLLTSLQSGNAGLYTVVVANSSGSVTSAPALLSMLPTPNGPGSLDVTFDPTAGGQLVGPAAGQGVVKSLAFQPDGKLLIGGTFVGLNNRARNNLARLQPDGRLDETFSPGFGADVYVDDIAVQPDGQILIVGAFTRFNGQPRQGIARLHPDGSLDADFHPAVGGYPPTCLALQSDGKILVGGAFTNVCGATRNAMARLNPDGSLDVSFDAASVVTASGAGISALALQPDGKVLIAGQFTTTYDQPLARLNPDGSRDPSFATPQIRESGNVGWLFSLTLDEAGRILIGGRFWSVNGTAREGVARLNTNGSLDVTFDAGPLAQSKEVTKVALQSDGKVLIGGTFLQVNGTVRHGLARLLTSGAVDSSFDSLNVIYSSTVPWVNDLALDSSGCPVVASGTPGDWGRSPHPLCRLKPNGSLDVSFSLPVLPQASTVGDMAVQADGKLLVLLQEGSSVNGQPCGPLARLRQDGTLDSTFTSSVASGRASCVLVQPDGKILLGGEHFVLSDQTLLRGVLRLNPSGTFDSTFQTEGGDYPMWVSKIALQPDGRILVNGEFGTMRGADRSFVARLNINGTLDESFRLDPQIHPDVGEYDPPINCVAAQDNGKILIGGYFIDGYASRLIRLNPDGSFDRDLLSSLQTDAVQQVIVQPDGKLLVSGRFNPSGGAQWQDVVRILPDGSLDTVFPSTFNWASSLALQADGKVLITVIGEPVCLVRYNANGTLDSTFAPDLKWGPGAASLDRMALQPDGRLFVAGSFASASGIPWRNLARLNNDVVVPRTFVTRQLPGQHGAAGAPIQLVAQPPATIAVYALEDQPPPGWAITNISHGGVLDALTGKVKFGPFFDNEPRTFSYEALPPTGFVGVGRFAGLASADGINSPIIGDDRMLIAWPHPADHNPADWAMRLDEVTAYAAAWRTGGVWPLPPNPIPIGYVTRAAALWRAGETYTLDPDAGAAPLCWVNVQPLPRPQGMGPDASASALRRLPGGYLPQERIEVSIEVTARHTTLAYALEETVPAGWRIDSISHGGAFDPLHGQIKWGPFCDATPRTLRYQLVPPAAASGPVSFAGSASFDGAFLPVGGSALLGSTSRLAWSPEPGTGRWALQVRGALGASYLIETSTNLVQWTPLTTITNSLSSVVIPNPVWTDSPQQYYRARLVR
jgi:uncharacterized delta-60 repeat protein